MALLDRNSRTDDCSKFFEGVVEVLVSPGVAEAFDKDVAADLDILQQLLVVREGSARLAVNFREPHLFQQLCGIQDVLEASKCVVEVAHLRPDK